MQKIIVFVLIFSCYSIIGFCQPQKIINTKQKYFENVKGNNIYEFVNLKNISSKFVFDLRYATINNFTKTNLYKNCKTTYLLKEPAMALYNALTEIQKQNFSFKIFDAYRPYSATKLMWKLIHDERYVANPKSGSNHNRGLSIDITLVDKNNDELNMGTGFDNFTDTANHDFMQLPTIVLQNRKLLKTTMEKYGFKALDTEWWHYTFITKDDYPIIDLSFKKMKKVVE